MDEDDPELPDESDMDSDDEPDLSGEDDSRRQWWIVALLIGMCGAFSVRIVLAI